MSKQPIEVRMTVPGPPGDPTLLIDDAAAALDKTYSSTKQEELLDGKVDKVEGKGLSTEDYTTEEKTKMANVPDDTNAQLADYAYEVKGIPYNRGKWDNDELELFNASTLAELSSYYQATVNNVNTFNGRDTIKLESTSNVTVSAVQEISPSLDFSNYNYIRVQIHVEDFTKVSGYTRIRLYTTATDYYEIDLSEYLYYRPYTENNSWLDIRVPKSDIVTIIGTPTYANINSIAVIFRASTNNTTYISVGLISAININKGVVQMHFDDGYENQYSNGFRIMSKYNLKGLINVITNGVGVGDNITWDKLREMQSAGWTVASHSHTHPNLTSLTPEQLHEEFKASTNLLKGNGFDFGSKILVTPGGAYDINVYNVAKEYFLAVRGNNINGGFMEFPTSRNMFQVYQSPLSTHSVAMWKGWIDEAITKKKQITFAWHRIVDEASSSYSINVNDFEEVCAYIRQKIDEGVLECIEYRQLFLQSKAIEPIDDDGNVYPHYEHGQLYFHNINE